MLQKINLFSRPKSSLKSNKDNYFPPQKILDNETNTYKRERERGRTNALSNEASEQGIILTQKHCPTDKKHPQQ